MENLFFWLGMFQMILFAIISFYYSMGSNVGEIMCPECYTLNSNIEEKCYKCGAEIQDY